MFSIKMSLLSENFYWLILHPIEYVVHHRLSDLVRLASHRSAVYLTCRIIDINF